MKKQKNFDSSGKCIICRKPFKSDLCVHSITQCQIVQHKNTLLQLIRKEIQRNDVPIFTENREYIERFLK